MSKKYKQIEYTLSYLRNKINLYKNLIIKLKIN